MACCRDFTRTQLIRHAAAEAGRGLPAIEPGMPTPAGTGLSRRSFLVRGAGLALAVRVSVRSSRSKSAVKWRSAACSS